MAIYECNREVEPGTIRNKFNKWSERVLNPGSLDLKASVLTPGPHCLCVCVLRRGLHSLINSTSLDAKNQGVKDCNVERVSLPFNDQTSASAVKRQIYDPSHEIGITVLPIFVSKKAEQNLKPKEVKPPIVNQQCVVYYSHVISAIPIMAGFLPDTSTNALLNIRTQLLASNFWRPTEALLT